MPIRLRLTLWYLATLLILLLLFASYFMTQAYFTLLEQTDNTLTLAAGQAATEVVLAPEPFFANELKLRQSMYEIDNDLTVMLVASDGSPYQQISHVPFNFIELSDIEIDTFIDDQLLSDSDVDSVVDSVVDALVETHLGEDDLEAGELSHEELNRGEILLGELNVRNGIYREEDVTVFEISQEELIARIRGGELIEIDGLTGEALINNIQSENSVQFSGFGYEENIVEHIVIEPSSGGLPQAELESEHPRLSRIEAIDQQSFVQDSGLTKALKILGNRTQIWVVEDDYADEMLIAEIVPTVVPNERFETVAVDGLRWRVHSQMVSIPTQDPTGDPVWLQVTQSLDLLDSFRGDMLMQMLWTIPLALLLAGLFGHWMARRALSPITQLITTAEEIGAQNLDRRIDYRGAPDEVGHLAQTMDTMFDRLQNAFNRERRFTGDAAHELRTPLTALKGKIDVTLSRERHPDEYADAVASMGEQVDRLIRLSSDLLFMARFDQQGKIKTSPTAINLAHLFNSVLDQLRPLSETKQLVMTQEIDPDLTISGDMDLLIRLFLNLLDNAIKYTPNHGTIHIHAQRASNGIQIQIRDSGIGIPDDDLPHLFTRFYRVDSERTRLTDITSGSGLGLAIAQEIVHAHQGTITAASTLGHGTTLSVQLPA